MSDDDFVTLAECPPGVFQFDGGYGFKTEYGMTLVDENGANMPGDKVRFKVTHWPDAYCLESGETFWGGAKSHEERAKLLVRPLDNVADALRMKAIPVVREPGDLE